MDIIGTRLSREEFDHYVKEKNFGSIKPNKLVLHHTWKPKKDAWRGHKSITALKRYYENEKKWSAGPHLFIAEDGIWLFTDMYDVGIHADTLNATWVNILGKKYKGWLNSRYWRLREYSIGIEVVGDYDNKVWEGETLLNALHVISALKNRLKIPMEKVYFHRDISGKSCPGAAITRKWLFESLERYEKFGSEKKTYEKEREEAYAWIKEMASITKTPIDKKLANLDFGWLSVVIKRIFDNKGL